MDFLDPKKRRQHSIILIIGYVLIGIAVGISSIILLYLAYGFEIGKNGQVVQNGLVFVSSQPSSAEVYLNGKRYKSNTNTRMTLEAGSYKLEIKRDGYHPWQRIVSVEGGAVEHYDYPLLVPLDLTTASMQNYRSLPGLATQSPDRRWLVVQKPGSMTDFELYDLKSPKALPKTVTIPASLISAAISQQWLFSEWANDNQHVVLKHVYDGKTEYIIIDIQHPEKSVNLNETLKINPAKLTLSNKKYDQYFVYQKSGGLLQTASLGKPKPVELLEDVLSYKTYGTNNVLYTTTTGAEKGEVNVNLLMGDKTYQIRQLPAKTTYLLDFTQYKSKWYVVAGAESENKVYVYKDPAGQLNSHPEQAVTPINILKVFKPNYLAFSDNARFIMAENKNEFAVYDVESDRSHTYKTTESMDAPQKHASWMDGFHLTYVSGGKLLMFDFDNANPRTLVPASPRFLPFFAPDYKNAYVIAPLAEKAKPASLTSTSLLIPADQ